MLVAEDKHAGNEQPFFLQKHFCFSIHLQTFDPYQCAPLFSVIFLNKP